MNQISTGAPESNSLSKEKIVHFSVAAGSLWIMRHLLFAMVFYFMICQIPGIMVKADLLKCVCISLLLSMIVFLVTTALTLLGSLSYVTYLMLKNEEELQTAAQSFNLEWLKSNSFVLLSIIPGILFNAVLLRAFASFYPDLILVDGWTPALLAASVIVIANRSLHALQKHVVKLTLCDESKTVSGRA
ncbi:MAG: hypothetical protein K2Y39_14010 [Candidatus Obscuribacterales bacterium]|nr:hypothetical protein [Candidatus Obscuribacterales bacterium]